MARLLKHIKPCLSSATFYKLQPANGVMRIMTATPGEIGELAAKSHEKFFPIGGRVRCLTCSGKLTTIPCVYCTNRKDSPVYEFLEAMKRGKERCEDRDAADAELGC